MQMFGLQRRLRNTNISVTSGHPGMVATDIGREFKDKTIWLVVTTVSKIFGKCPAFLIIIFYVEFEQEFGAKRVLPRTQILKFQLDLCVNKVAVCF